MPSHRLWLPALSRACHNGSGATGKRLNQIQQPGLLPAQNCINSRRNSSSSTRWKTRQGKDVFTREAKVQGLKSRAAFKLLEMDAKYRVFKKGQTVVDLGYAPGSWSQVAVERTKSTGRVVGIDIIPAQPPKGVSTIQGNFLSQEVQEEVTRFLSSLDKGRPQIEPNSISDRYHSIDPNSLPEQKRSTEVENRDYVGPRTDNNEDASLTLQKDKRGNRIGEKLVDVVLSDMSAPWDQTTGFWKKSLSGPYRMMNTSGINFKDHAGSMDLCAAALHFSRANLRTGGSFICKFYAGAEDRHLEAELKKLFSVVHREKPESSRSASKEAYFVALRRKKESQPEDV